jgi:hypothetical protein
MLAKPPYIAAANIADTRIGYAWNEWEVEKAYKPAAPDLTRRMAVLSHRANIAMCGAMASGHLAI